MKRLEERWSERCDSLRPGAEAGTTRDENAWLPRCETPSSEAGWSNLLETW